MVARAGAAVYPYNYADLWKTEVAPSGKVVLVATSDVF